MKIFCIGIGGIGLSGVARILQSQGHEVQGSDASPSSITDTLAKNGIKVFSEHLPSNLDESFDLVIYSEAVPPENPERTRANELDIKSINYATALGMISQGKKTIAITGTHGKTTVTGMLTSILLQAGLDPTIIIGSKIDLLDGQNFRVGQGEWFLCEACEYRDNFLELHPGIVLINNLDPDHLDYFGTAERYYKSFQKLSEKIPEDGVLILREEDQRKLNLSQVKARIKILSGHESQQASFDLKVPGKHNQSNAFAARAVAEALDIPEEQIKLSLSNFHGTWRRFEYKGEINGAKIYDDYGHHPTEIKATIQAAREWYPDQQLVVIFQPHQYSRTREFFEEFTKAFSGADEVWITDIYQARDSAEDMEQVSAEKLSAALSVQQSARYVPMKSLPNEVQTGADRSKVFLIMGAGNINGVFQHLVFDAPGE
ncbi:MAG: UDP-N-acetylmuramate--L-alanine ligase [Candidatus Altimarinota bacterium]